MVVLDESDLFEAIKMLMAARGFVGRAESHRFGCRVHHEKRASDFFVEVAFVPTDDKGSPQP